MRFWVIAAIFIFAVILVFTIYNVAFQTENTTAFPNPIYKSMNIDTSSKYGLIAFSAVALCFLIWGFPHKK
jgi:hypothetical protein